MGYLERKNFRMRKNVNKNLNDVFNLNKEMNGEVGCL